MGVYIPTVDKPGICRKCFALDDFIYCRLLHKHILDNEALHPKCPLIGIIDEASIKDGTPR